MYTITNLKLAFGSLPNIKEYPVDVISIRIKNFTYKFEKADKDWKLITPKSIEI